MPIYRRYIKNKKIFKIRSTNGYFNFLKELKKLYNNGTKTINTETLHFLIRRHSYDLADKGEWKSKPRRYYFKFWIKIAESSGILKKGIGLGWIITEKVNRVNP